jgi:hypothetical protein
MSNNHKGIVGFALKSRLPSAYGGRVSGDAGGVMSYGADPADGYGRVAYYCGQDLEGSQTCRFAGAAGNEV